MRRCTSTGFFHEKVLPPLPPVDIPEESEVDSLLTKKKYPSTKSTWSGDATDFFVLLCSFLLNITSIILVVLVFQTQKIPYAAPSETLTILQRVISTLSLTVTSAVIVVVGKRYVLFKLARGGLQSRRVAVYSNPSIGSLALYWVLHGTDLPLLGLSAVWGLALATGLTVNDSWEMGTSPSFTIFEVPFGPFGPATPNSSWFNLASEQLTLVMSSMCLGVAGAVGLINSTSAGMTTHQSIESIYYPPLPAWVQNTNTGFSFITMMNGFNISMETLSSIPSTAQNLTCAPNADGFELWHNGSDNQTLSIIVIDQPNSEIFRLDASAVILGGTLSSSNNYTEFTPNGTSWPNVTPTGNQWALDIINLICNTTSPSFGNCNDLPLVDIVGYYSNIQINPFPYYLWSAALTMALGAYTFAMYPHIGTNVTVPITMYGVQFTARFEIYILILNIAVSFIVLGVAVRLRLASGLGGDFINATRLLLDPLKKPELFNASLTTTVDALSNPYMRVEGNSVFVLEERASRSREENVSTETGSGCKPHRE